MWTAVGVPKPQGTGLGGLWMEPLGIDNPTEWQAAEGGDRTPAAEPGALCVMGVAGLEEEGGRREKRRERRRERRKMRRGKRRRGRGRGGKKGEEEGRKERKRGRRSRGRRNGKEGEEGQEQVSVVVMCKRHRVLWLCPLHPSHDCVSARLCQRPKLSLCAVGGSLLGGSAAGRTSPSFLLFCHIHTAPKGAIIYRPP